MLLIQIAAALIIVWLGGRILDFIITIMVVSIHDVIEEHVTDTLKNTEKLMIWWWGMARRSKAKAFGAAIKEGQTARAAFEVAREG